MKQLFTLALVCACLSAHSQSGLMPYNPDSNGDALIGSEDLISILGVYNTLMIDSSLTCDYQGTELETWFGGLFDGTLIPDSLYVEYLMIDTVLTFLPGCPDPVDIEVNLERSYMLKATSFYDATYYDQWRLTAGYLGYSRMARLYFNDNGTYQIILYDDEVGSLTSYSQDASWNGIAPDCCQGAIMLPFPENWTIDEDGIQVDWYPNSWVANCEHFRLIPYWHEAE